MKNRKRKKKFLSELSTNIIRALENKSDTIIKLCNSAIKTSCFLCEHENYCHKKHDRYKNYEKCWHPISTEKLLEMIADSWN